LENSEKSIRIEVLQKNVTSS